MPITTAYPFVSDLPSDPAIYALYGGSGRSRHVAYVGITGDLRSRIKQHFVRRDSSVVTGTSATSLNPDLVTRVEWWVDDRFEDRSYLKAAELVAFEILDPALRSRGGVSKEAEAIATEANHRSQLQSLIQTGPSATVEIPTLTDALQAVQSLQERISDLEETVRRLSTER
jgi:hypothetical protein